MHLVSGVFKKLTTAWRNKDHKSFISSASWKAFDIKLIKQQIPSIIHRPVRSLRDHIAHFKVCLI